MVLQFYGFPVSTCSQRVAVILHEKEVPFEFHPIDIFKGEQKTAEYMRHQPFGVIPYINDDGFIVYESRAICRYIAARYASQGTPGLLPTELKANTMFEQAASIEVTAFEPSGFGAVKEGILKLKYRGVERDEAVFAAHIDALEAKLNGYEAILSKQKYLGGDEITLADLFHMPTATLLATASDVLDRKPNVARWWKDLSSREAWKTIQQTGLKTTVQY